MAARPSFAEAESACLALFDASSPQNIKQADLYLQALQNQPFVIFVAHDLLQSQHAPVRELAGTMLCNRLRSSIADIDAESCLSLMQSLLQKVSELSGSPTLVHSLGASLMRLVIKLVDSVSVQQLLQAPQIQQVGVWFSLSVCCSLAEEFRNMTNSHMLIDSRVLQQLQQCSVPLLQQLCSVIHEAAADAKKHAVVLKVLKSWGNRLGINCAAMCSAAAVPLVGACIHGLLQPPPLSTMAGDALCSVLQAPDMTMRQRDAEVAFVQDILQKLGSLHAALSSNPHGETFVAISSVLLDVTVNHGQLMIDRSDLAQFVLDFSLFLLQFPSRANREIVFDIFDTMWDACAETSEKVHVAGYANLLSALVVHCVPYAADFVSWESSADDQDDFDNHRNRLRAVLRDCCSNVGIRTVDIVLSSLPQQFTWQQLEAVYFSLNAVCTEWIHVVIGDSSGSSSSSVTQFMSFIAQHVIVDHASNTNPLMLQARLSVIESCAPLICRPGCELRNPAIQMAIRFLGFASTLTVSASAFEKIMQYAKHDILGDINSLAGAIGSCIPTIRLFGPKAAPSAHVLGRALSRSIDLLPSSDLKTSALACASESAVVQLRAAASPAPGFQPATTAAASAIDIDFIAGLCRFISRTSHDGVSDCSATLMQALQGWWPACSQAALASGNIEVVEKLCDMVKIAFHALMLDCPPFLSLVGPALVSILQSLHVHHTVDAAQVPIEFLGRCDPASEQWALLKGFVHTVMGTGVSILERSGGFDVNDAPGLGISSNPSLCVSLLELTLRCCIFAPALLLDLPCFPSVLMMVSSSLNYTHRNCCSISMQIISRMYQSPILASAIRAHTQTIFNIVCSTIPKIAPLEVLRVAGSAIRGILQSPHGIAVDTMFATALMLPAYAPVSAALKQRFVATLHINIGNDAKFCSFVKDFALVCRSLESEDSLIAYETATPPRAASNVHPSRRHLLGV